MKKIKLTRTLMAACSIVALTAVMYGCVHSGGDGPVATPVTLSGTQAGQTLAAGTYQPDAALTTAIEGASEADLAAAAGEHATDAMIALAGLDFSCVSGPCSVTVNDNGTVTTMGTIMVIAHVEPMPDPAIAQRADVNTAIKAASTAVNGLNDDSTDAQITAAETAVAAAKKAVTDASAVPADENTAHSGRISEIENSLSTAKVSRMATRDAADAAMKKAMAAAGKALHKALGTDPLGILETTSLSTTLMVTPKDKDKEGKDIPGRGVGTLTAGDSAGALGAWNGMHYSVSDAGTKQTDSAIVYTNRAAPKMAAAVTTFTADTGENSYAATTRTVTLKNPSAAHLKSDRFPTAGKTVYTQNPLTNAVSFAGSYRGASGNYRCTGSAACDATVVKDGIKLGGQDATWAFIHDMGAMTATADANYLYLGWWLREDADGPMAASAFTGFVGSEPSTRNLADSAFIGSATYAGSAAGKWAKSDPLTGGDAGHFTADATLSAKFGKEADAGISGTINNFMANEQSEPWSVALRRAGWDNAGAFSLKTNGTVWSIDGNAAAMSGDWSGQMYDEAPTDGSEVPTTALGTFQSEFGSTHRMVGAFGATKQ